MLPYGVPFESTSLLYLTLSDFFYLQFTSVVCSFLTPPIFYLPEGDPQKGPTKGYQFDLFLFYIFPSEFFFNFNFELVIGLF